MASVNPRIGRPKALPVVAVLLAAILIPLGVAGGTASADPPVQPSSNSAVSCAVAVSYVPDESKRPSWWEKVQAFVNPWSAPPETPAELYYVLKCAFEPATAAWLAANPRKILAIGVQFGEGSGGSQYWGNEIWGCGNRDLHAGGRDWFPDIDGSEVTVGCTPVPRGGFSNAWYHGRKAGFACMQGVQIIFEGGKLVRSFDAWGGGYGVTLLDSSGASSAVYSSGWRLPGFWPVSCGSVSYYENGVIPPDWGPGEVPDTADVSGCKGLTIQSDDVRGEAFVEGDEVPMTLTSLSETRRPDPTRVVIRSVEGVPRGSPDRWKGFATWEDSPDFTFVVGPDTNQFGWVFFLSCEDGTESYVYYDPSGAGGPLRVDDFGGPGSLSSCLAGASELGLDPSSWVPGLVDRLQCLITWSVTPTRSIKWHVQRLSQAADGTSVGDLRTVVMAPTAALREMSEGATGVTSVESSFGTVTFPVIPESVGGRVRLGLGLLVSLWAVRRCALMLGAAFGSRESNESC